jgi:hypothetical protein
MVEKGGRPRLSVKERQREAQRRIRWAREAKLKRETERQQATELPLFQATSQTERPKIIYLSQPEAVSNSNLDETQSAQAQKNATKSPQLPDRTIAFIQHSYAAGADEELDERRRLLLARAAVEPHKTLEELAPYAGIGTKERARQLLDTGIRKLYEADPQELQQRYDLDSLLTSRHKGAWEGVPFSAEHRARISESQKKRLALRKQQTDQQSTQVLQPPAKQ